MIYYYQLILYAAIIVLSIRLGLLFIKMAHVFDNSVFTTLGYGTICASLIYVADLFVPGLELMVLLSIFLLFWLNWQLRPRWKFKLKKGDG